MQTRSKLSLLGMMVITGLILTLRAQDNASASDPSKPIRLYINVNESERLNFDQPVDDATFSKPAVVPGQPALNVVGLSQPADNVLLIDARSIGKTTVTVITRDKIIHRYFVSTFENRGADILKIQNTFAEKGYRGLDITFDKDQATLKGSVPTQEELDDAINIVKKYTPYVQVKAVVGQLQVSDEVGEDEAAIVNSIQRIANIPGLIVKVKFARPQETSSSTYTKQVGEPLVTQTTTDTQTRLSTTSLTTPPGTTPGAGAEGTEKQAREGTLETVTITKNRSIPEKIFLFGNLADDLQEARAIRVARTFCPLVISFINVVDPIQVRYHIKFVEVQLNKFKDIGLKWSGLGPGSTIDSTGSPSVSVGLNSPSYNLDFKHIGNSLQTFSDFFTRGVSGTANINATLHLLEDEQVVKILQEPTIWVANGQMGSFFAGKTIYYTPTVVDNNGNAQPSSPVAIPVGVTINVAPIGLKQISASDDASINRENFVITGSTPSFKTAQGLKNSVGNQPQSEIDNGDNKYVDENGLISFDVYSSVSAILNTSSIANAVATIPDLTQRQLNTRAHVHDGQSVVLSGLIDENTSRTMRKMPLLADIPVFGWLFKNPVNSKDRSELVVILTPEIVRNASLDSKRMPKPRLPELQDMLIGESVIPKIKPVRYDAKGVDLRPDLIPAINPLPAAVNDGKEVIEPKSEQSLRPEPPDESAVIKDAPDAKPPVAMPAPEKTADDALPVSAPAPAPEEKTPSSSSKPEQPVVDTAPPSSDTPTKKAEEGSSSTLP